MTVILGDRDVLIERILPNPMRDFKIYPMHPERIATLAKSYNDKSNGGDFGTIIAVRPHPTREGFYQQACGHHRVATMKAAGQLKVYCQIRDRDDEEMASIMIRENIVNYGNNAQALADSVAAICKVLSLQMFLAETWGDLSQIRDKYAYLFESDLSYATARGKLLERGALGERLIHKWITGSDSDNEILKVAQVREAVAHLNSTGDMAEIIGRQRKKAGDITRMRKREERKMVEAAKAAAERAERRAEEERQAAEAAKIAREEALAARREAEKRAREAQAVADRIKAEREVAEAEARYAAEKVEAAKREKARKALEKIAAEEREKEEARKTKLAAQQIHENKLKAATKKAEDRGDTSYIHPEVITMITTPSHLEAFRSVVANYRNLFPKEKQQQYVHRMIEQYGDNLTSDRIRGHMMQRIEANDSRVAAENAAREARAKEEFIRQQREQERHDKWRYADRLNSEGSAALGRLAAWFEELDKAMQDPEVLDHFAGMSGGISVTNHIHALERVMPKIKERMNVTRSAIKTADIETDNNVIDIQ